MSAPPSHLLYTDEAKALLRDLAKTNPAKNRKMLKTLRLLQDIGPAHPGLSSHKYHLRSGAGGQDLWESYVENGTPGAWRIWWLYGPEADSITIVTLGPHP